MVADLIDLESFVLTGEADQWGYFVIRAYRNGERNRCLDQRHKGIDDACDAFHALNRESVERARAARATKYSSQTTKN